MLSEARCPVCNSSIVARSQEEEGFICFECNNHFPYGEAGEEFRYSLNLVDYGLPEIPGWVFDRPYLKEIDLSAEPSDPYHAPFVNRISSISHKIGLITSLEELDMTGNCLSEIPDEIEKCHVLKTLYLGRNFIKFIPKELGSLIHLETLNLRYNLLERLPEEIGFLTNLKILRLENNNLKSLPPSIVNLTELEDFNISGNGGLISPPYDVAIKGMPAVKEWFAKY